MIIRVKVFPESKKELVKKIKEGKYEIYVKERPWHGEANERVLQILKTYFPEAKGIKMLSGGTRPNKTFDVVSPEMPLI